VRIPANAHNVAYEVELAVVIGRRCRQVSPEDALDNVAGYTLANDMGDRVLEKRTTQWASGKMFDTFTPLGPVMVTRDELNPFDTLEMSTHLNGNLVQHGFITGMFFNVPDLVSIISELTTLYPGDVLLCGSPKMIDDKPNPSIAIKPGDLIEVSIEKLGTLSNQAISEEFLEK
jgi:2-keto-4-pentenoate hydratase/2-oxohepta-3-ene-1,7-dioic acid hydratase in catechol pathway